MNRHDFSPSAIRWRGSAGYVVLMIVIFLSLVCLLLATGLTGARSNRPAPAKTKVTVKTTSAATNRAARTITYTYDEAGRLTQVDYGGGKRITYTYDKAGNLLRRTVQ